MGIFQNSFFSVAGQLERLTNVKDTLIAAVTGKGVQSNTGIKVVDTALSAAASNPFTTALPVGLIKNPAYLTNAAAAAFKALPTAGKAAVIIGSPIVISAAVANPKIISSAATAPKQLTTFGSNLGALSKDPSLSGLLQVAKQNPLISSAIVGSGLLVAGGSAGTISTLLNTSAVKKNTAATALSSNPIITQAKEKISSVGVSNVPKSQTISSESSNSMAAAAPTAASPIKKATKKKKKVAKKKKKVAKKKTSKKKKTTKKKKVYKKKKK